jgi:tetratricopeptide (TPR) repeat protein
MRRWILPGIPFLLSFALSLSTAGSHCYWQDSGFFLVAVKELGILYPPGFALYVLLCKAWTMALWFVDFTYAVHLFSATCAALAAGTIAVAARDLLRTKGPIFKTVQEEGPLAEGVGASIGCLAASGYTFWAAAILAKVYAFYYLVLTLLIWRMIRADESGKPRDFTVVAVLIGLSWQAHPSATLVGLALILFVGFHRKVVGWKGLLWRTGLAALCAIGPIHLLPLFKHYGGSVLQFGEPDTLSGFVEYVTGARFTTRGQNFGLEASRVASVPRYLWEEFLGIGVILLGAGAYRLWSLNRRLLIGLTAWVVPVLVITVLFKLEGQHDFWMVAAWIPLWLAAAVGMSMAGKLREAAVAAALIGTIWAVIANRSDLDQRNYTLAETLGRYYLQGIPEKKYFGTSSDDAYSLTLYLQRIRGESPSLRILAPYSSEEQMLHSLRFENNIYFESRIGSRWGYVAAGPLFRGQQRGEATWTTALEEWKEPLPAEEIPGLFRRLRGQFLLHQDGELRTRPEAYEHRLLRAVLLARKNKADVRAWETKYAEAAALYESILRLDPGLGEEPTAVFPLAVIYVGLQQFEKAEATFKKALRLDLEPSMRAQAYYFLAALYGNRPEASDWKAKALASPDLPRELRAKLEGR